MTPEGLDLSFAQRGVGGRRARRRGRVGLGTPAHAAGDRHRRAPGRGGRVAAARARRAARTGSRTAASRSAAAHVAVALVAYALFLVAALQALVLMGLEKRLHRRLPDPDAAALPPLLTLERFLFRLVAVGFVLLTLTLASGMLFSEQLFGKPLHVHAQERVLGAGLAHVRRAAVRPLALRLARPRRAALDHRRHACSSSSPTSAASSCSRSCSGADATRIGRHPAEHARARARGAARRSSGFFSIAETAMMAVNRYRLKHRAQRGERGAQARARAARQDRHAARRDPARQQPDQRRRGDADRGDHRAAVRRRRARAGARHGRRHVRDPRVLGDHAEGRSAPRTPTASRRS